MRTRPNRLGLPSVTGRRLDSPAVPVEHSLPVAVTPELEQIVRDEVREPVAQLVRGRIPEIVGVIL